MHGYGFPASFVKLVMTCITITNFTVKVNGEGYGYFEGRRGLRQGDPISPLLFVLVMEYLTRILKKMSDLPDFKYHHMCKSLKLTHLIFTDDLIIFCKGDYRSIARVMEALHTFSDVIGLIVNVDKSNNFLASIDDTTKKEILASTGFSFGTLTIRYLGLPLFSKCSKMECHQLVGKITSRINITYSKCLSHAGRLQIINIVLFSIYNFWGPVFILP